MIIFTLALLLLIGGYVVYGAYVNRIFGPDNRKTPALLMTLVCSTYICIAPEGLELPQPVAYGIGGACTLIAVVWFIAWYRKERKL